MKPFLCRRRARRFRVAVAVLALASPAVHGAMPGAGGLLSSLANWEHITSTSAIVAQTIAIAAAIAVFILRRRAVAREQAAADRVHSLLEQAECLLWEAEVRLSGPGAFWSFRVQPSGLYRRLFGNRSEIHRRGLWENLDVPDRTAMDARALAAIRNDQPGYEHEFRVNLEGTTVWLRETVSISSPGPQIRKVVGVVTDITALHAAEEARQTSERELQQILAQTACVLWRARVVRTPDGVQWSRFSVPASGLSGELFSDLPALTEGRFWDLCDVPDLPAMNERSRHAILSGAAGYEQEFSATREGRLFWLHERVTIKPVGPDEWQTAGVVTDVTAQHEAETARRASEAEVERLLAAADCLLWRATVTETSTGAMHWVTFAPRSHLYSAVFGHDPVPTLALPWSNVVDADTQAQMDVTAREALHRRASTYDQEFRAERAGQTFWLHEQVTIARETDCWSLVGVVTDITARRIAEEAVRASESRFRELLEHAPVAILQADFSELAEWLKTRGAAAGTDFAAYLEAHPTELLRAPTRIHVSDVNTVALRLFGAQSREHLHAQRRRLFVRQSFPAVRGALLALAQGENTFEADTELRDLNRGVRHLHLRWWLARRGRGLDLAHVIVVLVDWTNLKRAEAELATEKERLAVTLRAMTEGVITTDTGGTVQFINPAAAQLTQQDPLAVVGREVGEVCMLEEDAAGLPVAVPVARVVDGDAVIELPARTRLVASRGGRRLVEGCCAPIHAADGPVIGTVLVLRDVTERERLEEELVRASKLESVGLLAGGIAHDFNNILTVVMGNITLGLMDAEPASNASRVLHSAEQAVLRARDLTQQLLTFAKGGDPIRAAVRLPQVVADAVQFALHGSRVRGDLNIAPDLWPADADKAQIGRVVQNLVLNAVQAMPSGGTVRLTARNERLRDTAHPPLLPGDYVRIAVADDGVGIKPEHLDHIFEPYFTTKQTGSGLGLATVYSIVRKHKGLVEVESRLGQGSVFNVWLPAVRDRQGAAETTPSAVEPFRMIGARVLFMDDEGPIRDMATDILQRLGCAAEMAEHGQDAVHRFRRARAENRPFDVVVMDLTVPGGMGGVEALKLLRQMDPQVRAIVSSGYSSDPVLAKFREYGFRGRVAKPYDVTEFARVLREVVGAA